MICRQQTQFKQFFSNNNDPMFVVSENGELTFSKSAALVLFQRSGSLEVSPTTKIFSFRTRRLTESFDVSSPTRSLNIRKGICIGDLLEEKVLEDGYLVAKVLDDEAVEHTRYFEPKIQ